MNYNPKPINASDITLPKGLLDLTEKIAGNVHDMWEIDRINQGWTYGPSRDDEKPCLVPYQDPPESEKDYDRDTAMETVKLIIKMGYHIAKG